MERIKKFKDEKMKALKEADFIICISENTRKDLNDYYNIEKKKTKVIYLSYLSNPEKKINVVKNQFINWNCFTQQKRPK